MNKLFIKNARIIAGGKITEENAVLVEDGRIAEVGSGVQAGGAEVLDARGLYLSSGFIDIHVHGGGGHDFMDGTPEAFLAVARVHAAHGTTTMVPTTLACEDEELLGVFDVFRRAKAMQTEGANLPGLHLEGPYFSLEQRGAQDPKYIRNPTPHHYQAILEAGGGDILRWSLAPELDGAYELSAELRRRGILAAVAHTDAFFEQVEVAHAYGFTHMTHLYSGMQGVRRLAGMRRAGAVEAAYTLEGMTVEAICDGIHLPGPLLRQIYRCIGPGRTALITDAMRAAGQDCRESLLGSRSRGMKVLVEDGVAWLTDKTAFAGSICTMDRAVRTMTREGRSGLVDAVAMATSTPAAIMGFRTKGRVEPGMDADLVLFDDDISVSHVIIGGRRQWM